jgi:hypothetical protein
MASIILVIFYARGCIAAIPLRFDGIEKVTAVLDAPRSQNFRDAATRRRARYERYDVDRFCDENWLRLDVLCLGD